jgi:hypothetical protein
LILTYLELFEKFESGNSRKANHTNQTVSVVITTTVPGTRIVLGNVQEPSGKILISRKR